MGNDSIIVNSPLEIFVKFIVFFSITVKTLWSIEFIQNLAGNLPFFYSVCQTIDKYFIVIFVLGIFFLLYKFMKQNKKLIIIVLIILVIVAIVLNYFLSSLF